MFREGKRNHLRSREVDTVGWDEVNRESQRGFAGNCRPLTGCPRGIEQTEECQWTLRALDRVQTTVARVRKGVSCGGVEHQDIMQLDALNEIDT